MSQVFVALGQGTGPIRVSQAACLALHDHYHRRITGEVIEIWGREAVQVLERIRAIGRLAAARASVSGRTAVTGSEVIAAAKVVERESDTTLCGGGPPPKMRVAPDSIDGSARDGEEPASPARGLYTRDGIMAQILVAFGQGTGPVRVGQHACLELREHYYAWITDEMITVWGSIAVQALERIRAIGRLVAANAAAAGQTAIKATAIRPAATLVERESDTEWCPPHDQAPSGAAHRLDLGHARPAAVETPAPA